MGSKIRLPVFEALKMNMKEKKFQKKIFLIKQRRPLTGRTFRAAKSELIPHAKYYVKVNSSIAERASSTNKSV